MAKRRDRPAVNPLVRDHVAAIVGPVASPPVPEGPAPQTDRGAEEGARGRTRRRERSDLVIHIKTRVTASEAKEVERLARTLSSYMQSTVKGSEVTRALWTLAIRAQDELATIAAKAPKIDRPSYGDRLGMAEYEDAIADFLLLALKQTRRR